MRFVSCICLELLFEFVLGMSLARPSSEPHNFGFEDAGWCSYNWAKPKDQAATAQSGRFTVEDLKMGPAKSKQFGKPHVFPNRARGGNFRFEI